MQHPPLEILIHWLRQHPGPLSFQEEGNELKVLELFSGKTLSLRRGSVESVEERSNRVTPGETYVVALLSSGGQVVFSPQGIAFPPDFTNTGPMSLPNQVYCLQDYQNLMNRLRHLASEADRGREALEIVLVLIAILDGAKAVGLDVDPEIQAVETILATLERGETLPPPH